MELDKLNVVYDRDVKQKSEMQYLDSLELDNYLTQDWSINKIMSEIQEDHGGNYDKESYIFNCITEDEFDEYIKKRYKGRYQSYLYTEIRFRKLG